MRSILEAENVNAILRCCEVTAVTEHEGIIEYLDGFVSLHELKKHAQEHGFTSLDVTPSFPLHHRSTSSARSTTNPTPYVASAAT